MKNSVEITLLVIAFWFIVLLHGSSEVCVIDFSHGCENNRLWPYESR